jgi:hypothetical protein
MVSKLTSTPVCHMNNMQNRYKFMLQLPLTVGSNVYFISTHPVPVGPFLVESEQTLKSCISGRKHVRKGEDIRHF